MHLNDALGEDMDEVEIILHGNAGELGDYNELAVPPDKIASYLYECAMPHTDSHCSQMTGAILMCMESSSLSRLHTCHLT